ncbi:MAG: class I SAM-dependent methyltransferase [Candidatus Bathyarchaeia archaeon]
MEVLYQKYLHEKSHLKILDAGCGQNLSSFRFIPDKARFIGVDISFKNLLNSKEQAKNNNRQNVNLIRATLTNLPFKGRTFDVIICCDVLEHIKDKQYVINEISRVCDDGAILIGSTSNLLNPIMMTDCLLPKKITNILVRRFAGNHYERHSRLTPFKLIKILAKNFRKYEVSCLGFPPFKPWVYQFSNKKPPRFAYIWIAYDKITNRVPLKIFKETIIFLAKK